MQPQFFFFVVFYFTKVTEIFLKKNSAKKFDIVSKWRAKILCEKLLLHLLIITCIIYCPMFHKNYTFKNQVKMKQDQVAICFFFC